MVKIITVSEFTIIELGENHFNGKIGKKHKEKTHRRQNTEIRITLKCFKLPITTKKDNSN